MFRRSLICALSIISLTWLCGCGTVSNFADPLPDQTRYETDRFGLIVHPGGRQIYGGARSDLVGFYGLTDPLEPAFFIAGAYTVAIDLPLSLVGDTLTLPWTISATRSRVAEIQAAPSPQTDPSPSIPSTDNSR
jgi:uncharacterized protein YceK